MKSSGMILALSAIAGTQGGCGGGDDASAGDTSSSAKERKLHSLASDTVADLPLPETSVHVLGRISFGINQSELDRIQSIGIDAYIQEQLFPESIYDPAEDAVTQLYPTTQLSASALYAQYYDQNEFEVRNELRNAMLYRACYSTRQLYELMVEFWTNHFSIENFERQLDLYKTIDDREVIRPHAMGRFRDLLHATAKSPAMLSFLDNHLNRKTGPNENYARELMELHTLGIDGGYTEEDIKEVARCFTGWTIRDGAIEFEFSADDHDDNGKLVLDNWIPPGQGITDGEQVLDALASHPATARFIATKLVRRFVADDPPQSLVAQVANTYTATDGDIREMLNVILTSTEFYSSADAKFKRPVEYLVSAVRAMAPDPNHYQGPLFTGMVIPAGQEPFRWPDPDGFPDVTSYWISTLGMSERWKFVTRLAIMRSDGEKSHSFDLIGEARTPVEIVDVLIRKILRRDLYPEDRDTLIAAATINGDPNEVLLYNHPQTQAGLIAGMLMSSPYFMLR